MEDNKLDNKAAAPLSTASFAHAETAHPVEEDKEDEVDRTGFLGRGEDNDDKAVKFDCGHSDENGCVLRHRMEDGLPVDEFVCHECAQKDYSGDSLHGA